MKAPLSWIRDVVDLGDIDVEQLTDKLTMLGLKLEAITNPADAVQGPLVVGKVLSAEPEPQKNGKTINWCQVDVGAANGTGDPQGIVCGAHNFGPGDLVVVVLPGAVLPGDFEISARKTYGHTSAGMICSAMELGIGDDHDGIIVLPADAGDPGDDARGVLNLDDPVIEFEINPDRAYALSLRGIGREAALGFDLDFADPAERDVPAADDRGYPVVVDAPEGCPVFSARTVSGFDATAPTPDWMAQRLKQSGVRSLSLAIDITNYVMLELGQPIHGYDADKVQGALGVRRAQQGEKLVTLDDKPRKLHTDDLVITDESGPIGLAGVMGGASTEMSEATTNVVIESANWHAATMFRTGRRHKLNSEAGKRNERGVDPTLAAPAADRVVELMVELGGATAEPGHTLVGTPPERPAIDIAASLPARITGMEISPATTVANLEAVGCEVVADGESLSVTPPPWRPDITDPYDLVEEVARIVGYENVPSVLPTAPAGRGLSPEQRLRRRIGANLAGQGFSEVLNFPFVSESTYADLGIDEGDPRFERIEMANPLSEEERYLATTLMPGMLRTLARNIARGQANPAIFETASVYHPKGTAAAILGVDSRPSETELRALLEAVPDQPTALAIAAAGAREIGGWSGAGRAYDWADAVDAVETVATDLGLQMTRRAARVAPWHPGRCAELLVAGRSVGFAGELHPKVCERFDLPARTVAAEVNLDAMFAAVRVSTAPTFSSYPLAKEDLAVVVDATLPAATVETALRAGAGELLESISLFDVYTGDPIPEGKKSLAFALRLRATDRTLGEGEAVAVRDAALQAAVDQLGAEPRS